MSQTSTDLNIGDIVQLNSGGPDMRIVDFPTDLVTVRWDAADGEPQMSYFPKVCVRHTFQVTDNTVLIANR